MPDEEKVEGEADDVMVSSKELRKAKSMEKRRRSKKKKRGGK